MKRRLVVTLICTISIFANTAIATLAAQQATTVKQEGSGQQTFVYSLTQEGQGSHTVTLSQNGGDTVVFLSTEMSFDGKTVKGAPYSAQAINETIQMLADGNRIVRRNTANVYRDSEGRTRREQTLNAVGPYPVSGEQQQMIMINDPVAGTNYILNPDKKTGKKFSMRIQALPLKKLPEGAQAGPRIQRREPQVFDMPFPPPAVSARGGVIVGGGGSFNINRMPGKEPKKESLGKQTIEGVEAEGTRETITIAAGEIGNELPINIVTESWYSTELQTMVMTRHSDPRFGETTYKLININRSEQPKSLFELPADYTVDETINDNLRFKIDQEVQRTKKERANQSY